MKTQGAILQTSRILTEKNLTLVSAIFIFYFSPNDSP